MRRQQWEPELLVMECVIFLWEPAERLHIPSPTVPANKFRSRIRLQSGEHERNCKSLMSLLAFPICPGTEVTIQCEGEDEEEALKAMLDCIHKLKEIQPETKG